MAWAILLVFVIIMGILAVSGRKQVAWADKLRRIKAGVPQQAEWMAPDEVVQAVRDDYMDAMHWLPKSALHNWSRQWLAAPRYLSGPMLKQHLEILKHFRATTPPRYTGIMRCAHQVEVRHFSEDGERCLVIDTQSSRRMATYDYKNLTRLNTQDIGNGTVVYEMAFDSRSHRWKINRFIQELPSGWQNGKVSRQLRLMTSLPPVTGRDS
jgi:hypothetical protein